MLKFVNNWSASLAAPLAAGALTLEIAPEAAALLVGLGSGDYYLLTLANETETAWEIVKATAVTGGTVTIEREQEGTTAAEWPLNTVIEVRFTAGAAQALGVHEAASDPHPQYATASEVASAAGAAVTGHEAEADPHPNYVTGAELTAATAAIGDVLLTLRNPGASYVLPGSLQLQTAYPDLFALVGLIGGEPTTENWVATQVFASESEHDCIDTDGAGVWIMGASNGKILRSADDGATWTEIATGAAYRIMALTTNKAGIWLATAQVDNTLWRSTDNGLTWASVTTATMNSWDVCMAANGVAIAVGYGGKLQRSTNNGATWALVTSGFSATNIYKIRTDGAGHWVALGSSGKTSYSANDGASFTLTPGTPLGTINYTQLETSGDGVWIGNSGATGQIARSLDNGATWTVIAQVIQLDALIHVTGNEWVAFDNAKNVRRSLDGGVTWSTHGSVETYINGIAKSNGGELIAVGYGNKKYQPAPSYPYDPATQFKVPEITAPAGTTAYVKAAA